MTVTANKTLKDVLDDANPNLLADALAAVKLGTVLTPIVYAYDQSAAATVPLDPPALVVQSARTATGDTAAGTYMVADAGATPIEVSADALIGLATLSADGATLTFADTTLTGVVQYIPRPDTDLTSDFPTTGIG